jgi:hypothetical protein
MMSPRLVRGAQKYTRHLAGRWLAIFNDDLRRLCGSALESPDGFSYAEVTADDVRQKLLRVPDGPRWSCLARATRSY